MNNITTLIIDKPFLQTSFEHSLFPQLNYLLKNLSKDYPCFQYWLNNKVFNGLLSGDRILLLKKDGEQIIGISILKKSTKEYKICTLYVDPSYRDKSIGNELLEQSLYLLGNSKPLLTVSETKISSLLPLLTKYRFKLYEKHNSIYLPNKNEFVYNGFLQ